MWEAVIVENAGEVKKELLPTFDQMVQDMQEKLGFVPENYNYTLGWRTVVWQNKETLEYKPLTKDEVHQLFERGTIAYSRSGDGDNQQRTDSAGSEGDITQ